jgi:hypothetical protein
VYGIGIHGPKDNLPRDFTIGYKYVVQNSLENKELSKNLMVEKDEVKCPPAN